MKPFKTPLNFLFHLVTLLAVLGLLWVNLEPASNSFKTLALATAGYPGEQLMLAISAAQIGEFELAQGLYQSVAVNNQIDQQTELIIYPQKAIEIEIEDTTTLAEILPSRLLYLKLALLNWRLNRHGEAQNWLELATQIDPNDHTIALVRKIIRP